MPYTFGINGFVFSQFHYMFYQILPYSMHMANSKQLSHFLMIVFKIVSNLINTVELSTGPTQRNGISYGKH